MPANDNQDYNHHHHLRHHDNNIIFNPNSPDSHPNSHSNNPPKPNRKFLYLLLKYTIMLLIISLFFLFIGIAGVLVLNFFPLHRHRHNSRRRSTKPASYSAEDLQRHLPMQKYAAAAAGGNDDCAVCLEVFREGEWCRSLPDCRHLFHAVCVDRWLMKVANCPICRAGVRLNSGAGGSAMGDDDCKLLWAVGV